MTAADSPIPEAAGVRSSPLIRPPGKPLVRTRSASSTMSREAYLNSGLSGASPYDLPEGEAMAELQTSTSRSSLPSSNSKAGFKGGPPLKASETRRTKRARQQDTEHIKEEDEEDLKLEAELSEEERRADLMYARFSEKRKSIIVAIVAVAALLAPFSSSSFLPSIPQISEDLNSSPSIINVSVAIYILVIGLAPLLWAPYTGVYGRRPIYLISLPIFAVASLGIALSNSLAALIATRVLAGIGSSSVLSVGAGTIGDLYPRHRRGKAMGHFLSMLLIGPAVAPAVAGILSEYVKPRGSGWRANQWLMFAIGSAVSILVFFGLPETAHRRGIDDIRERRRLDEAAKGEGREGRRKSRWERLREDIVVLNPVAPLKLLMLPHIMMMSLNSSFVLMSTYCVLVPLSYTVAPRYNITNIALLGCFYLAQGVGNAAASQVTGRYADWMLAKWARKRKGVYVPEDRLRATLIGGGLVLPCSVLALGWILDRVGGKVGIALTIILLFIDGVGLMFVLTASNTYCIDVLQKRSAEVISVNNAVRYSFSAAASAFVLPLIHRIGVGWTNTFAAALCWAGFGLVCVTIRYGHQMRAFGAQYEGSDAEDQPAPQADVSEKKEAV